MGRKRIRRNNSKNRATKRRAKLVRHAVFYFKIIAAIFFVTMMSCVFIFGYDFLTQYDFFKIESIEVDGIYSLTKGKVIEQARISMGENILAVNLTTTRKRLLANPLIANAEIRREFPSRIRIRISEHEPLAVLDIGRRFIINTHGEIYREKVSSDPDTLPIVSGLEFSDINVPGQPRSIPFDAVMEVLTLGKETESVLPNRLIQKIHVDREIGITIYTYDMIKIIKLGYNDYPNKYKQLRNVLVHLKTRPDFTDLDSIDLNNLNRIVVNPSRREMPAGNHKEV